MTVACWIYAVVGALVPCLVMLAMFGLFLYDLKYRDPLAELDRKRVGM